LQAALELTTSNGVFALNEPITVRFHIRNVAATNIVIAGGSWRQDTGQAITIRDEKSRRVFPVNHIWYSGDPVIQRKILEPGQTATFRSTDLEFLFDDDRYGKVHWRAGDYFKVKPGRYTVCYRLRFPDFTRKSMIASNDVPQPTDWQGTLETAPATIEVKDIGSAPG
jgi:hypothetical protein